MRLDRRDFLRVAAAATAAGSMSHTSFVQLVEALKREDRPRVIWLQGSGCDGCAVSFLNSVHIATAEDLVLNTLDVEFQSNLQAVAGDMAIGVAEAAAAVPGYILVVEGATPVGAAGRYCMLWQNKSMYDALIEYSANAAWILALGACASFGGVTAGAPNPTEAKGVGEILGDDPRLINLPGCPCHPDWFVGTVVSLIVNGQAPPLDAHRRPLEYYGKRVHDTCFNRHELCGEIQFAPELGQSGCMELLGCKGKKVYSDCAIRKWNSGGGGASGVNWCVGARSPCAGCVEPGFPDAMSPFYVYSPTPDKRNEEG